MHTYGDLSSNIFPKIASVIVHVCACVEEYREFACLCDHVGGRTLPSFVFVMITHGGIKPQAARWSLSVWEPLWLFLGQAQQKS